MELKKFQSDVQSVSIEHTRELEKTIEDLQLEVAELRWKEEALRESEKRFRNIALSMVVWIWEIDKLSNTIKFWHCCRHFCRNEIKIELLFKLICDSIKPILYSSDVEIEKSESDSWLLIAWRW